jgi:hypothetical protein
MKKKKKNVQGLDKDTSSPKFSRKSVEPYPRNLLHKNCKEKKKNNNDNNKSEKETKE